MSAGSESRLRAWLELFRLPNLLTVPGDPLAGAFLAVGPVAPELRPLLLAVAASLCLYAAGLALNDLADLDEDRRDRPRRPLPSGRVSPRAARLAVLALAAAACGAIAPLGPAAWFVGALLAAAIAAYNLLVKPHPALGPLTMGACRGLSLLLGAAAVRAGDLSVSAAAGGMVAYIAGVTALARTETRSPARPRLIGVLLGLLLPIQALLVILSRNPWSWVVAALLLACWPLNRMLRRVVYSS